MPRGLVALLVVVCAIGGEGTARADLWLQTAGEFFPAARTIEIVRLDRLAIDAAKGTVVESIRGRAVGAVVDVPAELASRASMGTELLIACKDVCVGGPVKDGVVAIGSTAYVPFRMSPGLVLRSSLRALAARTDVPALCVETTVRFSDEPAARIAFRGTFSALDGAGIVSGAPFEAGPPAELFVGDGGTSRFGREAANLTIHPGGEASGRRPLSLDGEVPRAGAKAGDCLVLEVRPTMPFARTVRAFLRAVAGGHEKIVLAKGIVRVGTVTHPLVVGIDEAGYLRWTCRHFAKDTVWLNLSPDRLGFALAESERWLSLLPPGLAELRPKIPGADPASMLARLVPPGARVTWPVRRHGRSDGGTLVGEATLEHVPDPK